LLEKVNIKGMAHITGGGFIENAPRMLQNKKLRIVINKNSYPIPDIFKLINKRGVELNHMYNTFNMGIGFMVCVDKKDVDKSIRILKQFNETPYIIGHIEQGAGQICLK
jgi:phosphoribosylformylglycinamidine cyclo-ligase